MSTREVGRRTGEATVGLGQSLDKVGRHAKVDGRTLKTIQVQEYLADRTRGRCAVQDSYAPPNISIKLNSHQWPHVFHTDASSISDVDMAGDAPDMSADAEALLTANHQPSSSVSSILVWGLSPGKRYHIELGVFSSDAVDGKPPAIPCSASPDSSEVLNHNSAIVGCPGPSQ